MCRQEGGIMEVLELVRQAREMYPGFKDWHASEVIKFALKKLLPQEAEFDGQYWMCPSCRMRRKERFSHCVACGQTLKRQENEK